MRYTLIIVLLFALTVVLMSSMDIYVPIAPQLASLFEAPESFIKLTFLIGPLTSAFIGILAGYLSDRHGRRPIALVSLLLFWVGTLLCSLIPSFTLFFIGRLVQSLGVGSLLVLNAAILSDLYKGIHLARMLGLYSLLFPLTFAAAPIVGAQVYTWFGWQAVFALLLIGATPISLLIYWFLPETCEIKKESPIPSLRILSTSKPMLCLALTHALPMTVGILFTINGSFLYQTVYAFDVVTFSYVQAIPVAFQCVGTFFYRHVVNSIGLRSSLQIGYALAVGYSLFCLLIVLNLVGGPWISVLAVSLFAFGASFIITTAGTLLLDHSPVGKGLASSFLSLIRNLVIFVIATGASFLSNHSLIPTFAMMLAVVWTLCLLIPFVTNLFLEQPYEKS